MNRHQKRAFMRQFQAQVEQERNGAPPPPEIAARMTKPKQDVVLHQVCVEKRGAGLLVVGPAMIPDAAAAFADAINRMVASGKEKDWSNAHAVPCTPLQGVH